MIRSLTRSTINNEVWYQSMLVGNEAFIPIAYELIQTQLISTNTASVTFSNIPSTYKHLELRYVYLAGSSGGGNNLTFNSDSGANYATHGFVNSGTSLTSFGSSGTTNLNVAGYNVAGHVSAPLVNIITILDYASTSKFKATQASWGVSVGTTATTCELGLYSGLWRSLSAITSFTITSGGGNWANGSRLSLYGVKG